MSGETRRRSFAGSLAGADGRSCESGEKLAHPISAVLASRQPQMPGPIYTDASDANPVHAALPRISEAFVPPNPNEFVIALVTRHAFGLKQNR